MAAVRIGASFMLAVMLCIFLFVFPIFGVPFLRGENVDGGLLLTLLLVFAIPTVVLGGLVWLPVLLAVRNRSSEWRFAAVLLSTVASGTWIAVTRLWLLAPPVWGWEDLIAPSVFLIAFSALFLWVDRRWGEPPGFAVGVACTLLAAGSALTLWLLFDALWPNGIPS